MLLFRGAKSSLLAFRLLSLRIIRAAAKAMLSYLSDLFLFSYLFIYLIISQRAQHFRNEPIDDPLVDFRTALQNRKRFLRNHGVLLLRKELVFIVLLLY